MKKKSSRRKDGRLVRTVTDPRTGKRVYVYGKTEREIAQKMIRYQVKENGEDFRSVADRWWVDAREKISTQTVDSYRRGYAKAVSVFGEISIREITAKDIQKYLSRIAAQGYAYKTVANYRLIINLIFEYAVLENYIPANPCASVHVPKNLPKRRRESASTEDEEIIKKSSDIWLFPVFALYTGMRKGEILALRWEDIDFDHDIIHVTKSVGFDRNEPFIKKPKTEAGVRVVPLLSSLKEILINQHHHHKGFIFSKSKNGDKPLTLHQYDKLYKSFQIQTGVKCTAHQLRHSFATIAFECGIPVKSVQEVLGHKQLSTTMDIYTDFRQRALIDFKDVLDDFHKKK